jgi:hypothetical protein
MLLGVRFFFDYDGVNRIYVFYLWRRASTRAPGHSQRALTLYCPPGLESTEHSVSEIAGVFGMIRGEEFGMTKKVVGKKYLLKSSQS